MYSYDQTDDTWFQGGKKENEDRRNNNNNTESKEIGTSHRYSVTLVRENNGKFGIDLSGRFIKKIYPGTPAFLNGIMNVGDKLYAVNNKILSDSDREKDTYRMIQNSGPSVYLGLDKPGKYLLIYS